MAKVDEEKVKSFLSQWIQGKIFWEKKNKYGYPTFQCDTAERPDMLILINEYPVAVEVKHATNSSNVLDGVAQTLRYARDDLRFYVDHREIRPKCYVLATQCSIKGHLFDFEKKKIPPSEGRDYAASMGEIPGSEYRFTFQALRSLWRFAEFERDVHGWNWNVGVGFLLSTVLNNPTEPVNAPLIQAKIDKQQFTRVI
jgi:hypothetical protein